MGQQRGENKYALVRDTQHRETLPIDAIWKNRKKRGVTPALISKGGKGLLGGMVLHGRNSSPASRRRGDLG